MERERERERERGDLKVSREPQWSVISDQIARIKPHVHILLTIVCILIDLFLMLWFQNLCRVLAILIQYCFSLSSLTIQVWIKVDSYCYVLEERNTALEDQVGNGGSGKDSRIISKFNCGTGSQQDQPMADNLVLLGASLMKTCFSPLPYFHSLPP